MRFNQSVTTESEKNINNLFFKITQLRFLFIKKSLARRREQKQNIERQKRIGIARLIKVSNGYQSIKNKYVDCINYSFGRYAV